MRSAKNSAQVIPLPVSEPIQKKKPRNMTSDGRRCVRVDVGTDPETGKRIRKPFYGKTLKEAERKAEEFKQAQRMGVNVAEQNQKLTAWIDTWLDLYGDKAGFSANYVNRNNAELLRAALGRVKLTEIRQAQIQAFADSVAHYAKSTVAKIRVTTGRIFRAAVANRIITFNPCDGVVWQNSGEGTHRRLEDWEVAHIAAHWQDHRAGLWAMLMLFAGLRRGEALALRWQDIDLDAGLIHVRHGVHFEINKPVLGTPKTETSVRDVPILPPLRDALTAAPRLSEWVCTGAQGQQVTGSIWSSGWLAYNRTMTNILNGDTAQPVTPGRRSDLDAAPRREFSIRAHDLRHTYASMLYDADVDVKTAQQFLGHATPEITLRIYTHLSEERKQASLDKIAAYASALASGTQKRFGHQMGISKPETPRHY